MENFEIGGTLCENNRDRKKGFQIELMQAEFSCSYSSGKEASLNFKRNSRCNSSNTKCASALFLQKI